MNNTPTFSAILIRRLRANLMIVSLLIAAFFWGAANNPAVSIEKDAPAESPRSLVESLDCWTGAAPADMAGKIPGHVIVRDKHGDLRHAGSAAVDKALGQIFEGEDHGLNVYAFCR